MVRGNQGIDDADRRDHASDDPYILYDHGAYVGKALDYTKVTGPGSYAEQQASKVAFLVGSSAGGR